MKFQKNFYMFTAITVFIFGLLIIGTWSVRLSAASQQETPQINKEINLKNFENIITSGNWNVEIQSGNVYRVEITASEDEIDKANISVHNGVLMLSNTLIEDQKSLQVKVTLPQLSQFELHGTTVVKLFGFKIKSLFMQSYGTSSIIGINNSIENLKVYAKGVSSINFTNSPTVNVDLKISGSNSSNLFMKGGSLVGDIKGAASITYSGTISSQAIVRSGLVSIQHVGV